MSGIPCGLQLPAAVRHGCKDTSHSLSRSARFAAARFRATWMPQDGASVHIRCFTYIHRRAASRMWTPVAGSIVNASASAWRRHTARRCVDTGGHGPSRRLQHRCSARDSSAREQRQCPADAVGVALRRRLVRARATRGRDDINSPLEREAACARPPGPRWGSTRRGRTTPSRPRSIDWRSGSAPSVRASSPAAMAKARARRIGVPLRPVAFLAPARALSGLLRNRGLQPGAPDVVAPAAAALPRRPPPTAAPLFVPRPRPPDLERISARLLPTSDPARAHLAAHASPGRFT